MKKTSILFPLYNDEQRLNKLFIGIKNFSKAKINKSYEFIFVDDGSADDTVKKINKQKYKIVYGESLFSIYLHTKKISSNFKTVDNNNY
jgi:glycosyltransferase involved in cell wall biosynthesis